MEPDIWVEVDLAALKHNADQVRRALSPGVKLIAVVKANGYGHGYVEPAKAFLESGAEMLAVTRLSEAQILRDAGISAPILALAPIQSANGKLAADLGISVTVDTPNQIETLGAIGANLDVHLKIDTGMGRLGVLPQNALSLAELVTRQKSLRLCGAFTHFAQAGDRDLSITNAQFSAFQQLTPNLKAINPGLLIHCANSAATLRLRASQMDAVRVGALLYGQYPSKDCPKELDLRTTWSLRSRIISLKEVPANSRIGYGGDFRTTRPTKIAIISAGFSDGLSLIPDGPLLRQPAWKLLARKWRRTLSVTVRGQSAPIIGRISMQLSSIDVTELSGVEVGDEIILPALRLTTNAALPRIYR
jgi:alanine racemase